MAELYWIITLGNLNAILSIILIVSTIIIGAGAIACLVVVLNDGVPRELKNFMYHKFPKFIFGVGILVILSVFVSSKQDLYLIYGLGTIIDYAQNNEDLKEIPDNAFKAINDWLTEETSKNN